MATKEQIIKGLEIILNKYRNNKNDLTQEEIGILTKFAYGAKFNDFANDKYFVNI